jgi:hypothetical protein
LTEEGRVFIDADISGMRQARKRIETIMDLEFFNRYMSTMRKQDLVPSSRPGRCPISGKQLERATVREVILAENTNLSKSVCNNENP